MANTLRHTGIVVTDIEKHISLWTAIMGFSVISDNLESGSQIESILGIPDVKVRTVKLIDDLKQTIEYLASTHQNALPFHPDLFRSSKVQCDQRVL